VPFTLKAYRNYEWVPLPRETFADYAAARARGAALLASGGAQMVAVCVPDDAGRKGRIAACLTLVESPGARPTEWPGVWEWAPAAREARAAAGAPAA
jgi:hypothetical protein